MKYDIQDILKYMPHRYPFLLIDRIESIEEDKVVGIKNVTFNEPFFQGHFPGEPVMPGVLIIESMVQSGGFLLLNRIENQEESNVFFTSIKNAKFRNPVRPGDVLEHRVHLTAFRQNFCKLEGKSYVDDEVVCEGSFTAAIVERKGV